MRVDGDVVEEVLAVEQTVGHEAAVPPAPRCWWWGAFDSADPGTIVKSALEVLIGRSAAPVSIRKV